MKFFICLGVLAIVVLQYRFWLGDTGHFAVVKLTERVAEEQVRNDLYDRRNRRLAAEITALKDGLDAVEARARTSLGMISEGETFFLVVDDEQTGREDQGGLQTP